MGKVGEKQKKKPKIKDKRQSERFKEAAREVGAEEASEAFDRIVKEMGQMKREPIELNEADFDRNDWHRHKEHDWQGNNAAFACPDCGRVFIVSGQIHDGRRRCQCGKWEAVIVGGRKSAGSARLIPV
jgi:hypothetical protein